MLRIALAVGLVMLSHFEPGAAQAEDRLWKEISVLETPGWLPGSVVYSPDGRLMVVGGTNGQVIAVNPADRSQKWKADVGGEFAAVAIISDGESIVATFHDGLRFVDAGTGELGNAIEEKESRPLAVGVFPDQKIGGDEQKFISHKVIFGNARIYWVKDWILPETAGTIELSSVAKDKAPIDLLAVPLAVDPAGRSVIVTGPIHRDTGKNVLWAWVAGNYQPGSPGNRLLEGHEAVVVSAAWSQDGKTAATGDSQGRVILWDATTMQETQRFEFGERVAAVALSNRGESIAVVVVGKQAEFYIWEAAQPKNKMTPIHVDASDFSGPIHACLTFSPDGRQLAGSAFNRAWLARSGELVGKLHVWKTERPKSETKTAR